MNGLLFALNDLFFMGGHVPSALLQTFKQWPKDHDLLDLFIIKNLLELFTKEVFIVLIFNKFKSLFLKVSF